MSHAQQPIDGRTVGVNTTLSSAAFHRSAAATARAEVTERALMGSYLSGAYTVEVYFPTRRSPEDWTIWVLEDGAVIGEFTERIAVTSVYGIDQATITKLEAAAEVAVAYTRAIRRSPCCRKAPWLTQPSEVL